MFDLYSKKLLILIIGITLLGLGAGMWWWFKTADNRKNIANPMSRIETSTWRYLGYFLMAAGGIITAVAAFLYLGKKEN